MISFPSTFIIKNTSSSDIGKFANDISNNFSTEMSGLTTDELLSENATNISNNTVLNQHSATTSTISSGLPINLHDSVVNSNYSSINNKLTGLMGINYENAFKMPAAVLFELNQYKNIYNSSVSMILSQSSFTGLDGKDKDNKDKTSTIFNTISTVGNRSLFNPYVAVQVRGFLVGNTPLTFIREKQTNVDEIEDNTVEKSHNADDLSAQNKKFALAMKGLQFDYGNAALKETIPGSNSYGEINIGDCSIKTLVKLSNTSKSGQDLHGQDYYGSCELGQAKFRYSDFMYCKDLGKVSNNHLIVLRKFPHPVGDNIYRKTGGANSSSQELSADIGRLISWFDTDDNKLEDICKYDYQMSWKQLNAEIEQQNSKEDQSGILPGIINLADPGYRQQVIQGKTGNGNTILGWTSKLKMFSASNNSAQAENHVGGLFSNYDKNKVYTPRNTVQDNHLYEGKLTFKQTINLKFSYKLRAYDNINPRSAFIDLIGNILAVTYQKGSFWGGERKIIGPQQNKQGWNKANDIINGLWGDMSDFLGKIASGGFDFSSLCGSLANAVSAAAKNVVDGAKEVMQNPTGAVEKAGKALKKGTEAVANSDAGKIGLSLLKNKLGRPQLYAFHSLVSGDNVGFWHLSVGNPRNPFIVMGNLIMTNASIQHSGPLGIDDFPSELSVTITLEHGKSRDATDIAKMYTMGKAAIQLNLNTKDAAKYDKNISEEDRFTQRSGF